MIVSRHKKYRFVIAQYPVEEKTKNSKKIKKVYFGNHRLFGF